MARSDTWMPPWSVVGMRGLFCLNQSNGGFYLSKYPHECRDSRFPTRKFQPQLVPDFNVVAGRRRHGVLLHHERLSHLTCSVYLNWTQICSGQLVKFIWGGVKAAIGTMEEWERGHLQKVGLSCSYWLCRFTSIKKCTTISSQSLPCKKSSFIMCSVICSLITLIMLR